MSKECAHNIHSFLVGYKGDLCDRFIAWLKTLRHLKETIGQGIMAEGRIFKKQMIYF